MVLCVDSLEAIRIKILKLKMELSALEERLYELERLEDYNDLIDYNSLIEREN